MTTPRARIYVTSDPNAKFRAIAHRSDRDNYIERGTLFVSPDGITFYDVLFGSRRSGPGYTYGNITQPALGIDYIELSYVDGVMTYNGLTYYLDYDAVIHKTITKPIMRIIQVSQTHAGFYVTAQDLLTGCSHDFLNGEPLNIVSGLYARGQEDVVADVHYEGHHYIVTGDHMDRSLQTATFDDLPVTPLKADDYIVTFPDDLTSVKVIKK